MTYRSPPTLAHISPSREAGRIVAGVILASGHAPPALFEQANRGLERLCLAPLAQDDFVLSTPEELAPLVQPHLRDALAELLLELAAGDPLRQRVALSYAGLWRLAARPSPPKAPSVAESITRAVIGPLPRHQHGAFGTDDIPNRQEIDVQVAHHQGNHLRLAPPVDPLRARIAQVRAEMLQVIEAVNRVVIGKQDVVTRVLVAMAARGHVLLVDAPGVGKTLLCKTLAGVLGARFGRIQLTPDLMPMDVTGATIYDPHAQKFVFRPGPIFTNILLADEINRATPKTQSALLEVMEERTVTVDGASHRMADPFQVLATMNPIDHDGTYPLPAAQIDRFMMMLELGYPTQEDEVRVLDTHLAESHSGEPILPTVSIEQFVEWQRTVPMVHASPEVKRAAVAWVDGLRRTADKRGSVSPRATLAWMRAAQACAILSGREFVTLEDLLQVAPDVLRHRLWMSAPEVRDRLHAMSGALR